MRTCRTDVKGEAQVVTPRGESTDAGHRDGLSRSSVWGGIQFERYADDIVCHCSSEREAQALKAVLEDRFRACGLTLHPGKTKIVYCKGGHNQQDYPVIAFDFLSYTFRSRLIRNRQGQKKVYFTAAISQKAAKGIRKQTNEWPWRRWRQKELGQFPLPTRPLRHAAKPGVSWIYVVLSSAKAGC